MNRWRRARDLRRRLRSEPAETPPAGLRERLVAVIPTEQFSETDGGARSRLEPRALPRRRFGTPAVWAVAASVLAVVFAGYLAVRLAVRLPVRESRSGEDRVSPPPPAAMPAPGEAPASAPGISAQIEGRVEAFEAPSLNASSKTAQEIMDERTVDRSADRPFKLASDLGEAGSALRPEPSPESSPESSALPPELAKERALATEHDAKLDPAGDRFVRVHPEPAAAPSSLALAEAAPATGADPPAAPAPRPAEELIVTSEAPRLEAAASNAERVGARQAGDLAARSEAPARAPSERQGARIDESTGRSAAKAAAAPALPVEIRSVEILADGRRLVVGRVLATGVAPLARVVLELAGERVPLKSDGSFRVELEPGGELVLLRILDAAGQTRIEGRIRLAPH